MASIKIPPVPGGTAAVRERVEVLRAQVSRTVTIGISGDPVAADALVTGCGARALSARLAPLWDLFDAHGSCRVVSALAEELGLVRHPNLPRAVLGLDEGSRVRLREALR